MSKFLESSRSTASQHSEPNERSRERVGKEAAAALFFPELEPVGAEVPSCFGGRHGNREGRSLTAIDLLRENLPDKRDLISPADSRAFKRKLKCGIGNAETNPVLRNLETLGKIRRIKRFVDESNAVAAGELYPQTKASERGTVHIHLSSGS